MWYFTIFIRYESTHTDSSLVYQVVSSIWEGVVTYLPQNHSVSFYPNAVPEHVMAYLKHRMPRLYEVNPYGMVTEIIRVRQDDSR
ncbi:MAG: hypothetical protein R3D00_10560 [Bacteroidia bacterium]